MLESPLLLSLLLVLLDLHFLFSLESSHSEQSHKDHHGEYLSNIPKMHKRNSKMVTFRYAVSAEVYDFSKLLSSP